MNNSKVEEKKELCARVSERMDFKIGIRTSHQIRKLKV